LGIWIVIEFKGMIKKGLIFIQKTFQSDEEVIGFLSKKFEEKICEKKFFGCRIKERKAINKKVR